MELPENSIGISDLLTFVECPRKMSWGMRRHVGRGQQSEAAMPEASQYGAVYARYYGSAVHMVLHDVEDGYSDEDAIQRAWTEYGEYLDVGDLDLLRGDLETYRTRDFPQTRLVASEGEFRVPLFVHPVYGQIYFRFKIDRLYERLDAPGTFLHIDYKSSRHAKSQVEINEDKQLWAYNFGIYDVFPEVDRLIQVYDQLRFGQLVAQRKTDAQRRQMKDWLIKTATAVLDKKAEADGLLPFKKNEWCAWCPILESCGVVENMLDFGLVEIEALAPTTKEGRKTVPLIEEERVEEYVARFGDAKQAIGVLERFRDSVGALLKRMPADRRAQFGYDLNQRRATEFDLNAKRALVERYGLDTVLSMLNLSKSSLESHLGEDEQELEWALELGIEVVGAQVLSRRK